jgi:integrase
VSPRRKTLARFGRRGDQVRVCVDSRRDRVEVYYKDLDGVPHKRIHANTKEGRAEATTWAETYLTERTKIAAERLAPEKREPLTIRELWEKYLASPAFQDLRDATKVNYPDRWKKWEAFMKPEAIPDQTTLHDIDRFRAAALATGLALNTVRGIIQVVRIVYNWGQSRKLTTNNDLALFRWKQPKDVKSLEPGEFTRIEYEALLRTFDPTTLMDGSLHAAKNWRPWVTLMIMGHHGQRWRSVRHLRESDLNWETGLITWPGKYQKQGKDVIQPITHALYSALLVARYWQDRHLVLRPTGRVRGEAGKYVRDPELRDTPIDSPWILFAERKKTEPYSYSSFQYQLVKAEREAVVPDGKGGTKKGIAHEDYRGGHAFRRMTMGDILEATGDLMTAMNYLGDSDLKQSKSYDRRKQERIAKASATIEEGR